MHTRELSELQNEKKVGTNSSAFRDREANVMFLWEFYDAIENFKLHSTDLSGPL